MSRAKRSSFPTARRLTDEQFQGLPAVPAEAEWFANIDNRHTRRAYENDVKDFTAFVGIRRPEEFRIVTRAHLIAWRKRLEERQLSATTIRRKLSAMSSLYDHLCDRVEDMLVVLGTVADRTAFQMKARGQVVSYAGEDQQPWHYQPLCFNNFVHVPLHLVRFARWTEGNIWAHETPDAEACGGCWEETHWGCRYGPVLMRQDRSPEEGRLDTDLLIYYFDTRNAVPVAALRSISKQWPTLHLELFWQAEWEVYDPTHLIIFADGECIEDRTTTVNMYEFRPELDRDENAVERKSFAKWTEFRAAVSADWLPEWADIKAELEKPSDHAEASNRQG